MKAFTHMRLKFKPEMVTREKQLFFSLDDQLTFTHAHTFDRCVEGSHRRCFNKAGSEALTKRGSTFSISPNSWLCDTIIVFSNRDMPYNNNTNYVFVMILKSLWWYS